MIQIGEMLKNTHSKYAHNPLISNSIYILTNYALSAVFGLLFWVLAARLYSQEAIGTVTTLLSSIALIVLLSRLGLDQSIIRYFPSGNKDNILLTSLVTTTLASLLFGSIFALLVVLYFNDLSVIFDYPLIYFGVLTANSIYTLFSSCFVGLRHSRYQVIQSLSLASRLLLIIPLVHLGSIGLFGSVGLSFFITVIISAHLIHRIGFKRGNFDISFLKGSFAFSAANFLVGILLYAPNQIVSLLIFNISGATSAAAYYVCYTVAGLLFTISLAVSTSLFVEGSHGGSLKDNTVRAFTLIYAITIPVVVSLYLSSEIVLCVFSHEYVKYSLLLQYFALTALFIPAIYVYLSIQRVRKQLISICIIASIYCVLLLSLSYVLLEKFDLIGIGYAWLGVHILLYIPIMLKIFQLR